MALTERQQAKFFAGKWRDLNDRNRKHFKDRKDFVAQKEAYNNPGAKPQKPVSTTKPVSTPKPDPAPNPFEDSRNVPVGQGVFSDAYKANPTPFIEGKPVKMEGEKTADFRERKQEWKDAGKPSGFTPFKDPRDYSGQGLGPTLDNKYDGKPVRQADEKVSDYRERVREFRDVTGRGGGGGGASFQGGDVNVVVDSGMSDAQFAAQLAADEAREKRETMRAAMSNMRGSNLGSLFQNAAAAPQTTWQGNRFAGDRGGIDYSFEAKRRY